MAETLSIAAPSISAPVSAITRIADDQPKTVCLIVENMRCGSCMAGVERTLKVLPGVRSARANLSAKRVEVTFDPAQSDTENMLVALDRAGFHAAEYAVRVGDSGGVIERDLLRRLGVAGFAAMNIMLLSVSVWAGLASDMGANIQGLFHWLSAAIALPAIAYAAQPFFRSALSALKARRLNMDVPISLGIILATSMSVFQTMRGTPHVYFDAAVTLTFFLLVGRYLDAQVRVRARSAAENLLGLKALSATLIDGHGNARRVAARELKPGMRVLVAAGERVPVDGRVCEGASDIEDSLITGETLPKSVRTGAQVHAGTVNLIAPLIIEAVATDENTLIAEIARLMQAAEQCRGRYVRLADRAARIYAPAVHVLGLTTFVIWMLVGAGWETSLTYAIAVLIITCPCALALAVPAVQVAATSRLFAKGILVKAADGLERLADINSVVIDKTGTLTLGEPRLVNSESINDATLTLAASLATTSRHPYARAIVREVTQRRLAIIPLVSVSEVTGCGLLATTADGEVRLGSAAWAGALGAISPIDAQLWLAQTGQKPIGFRLEDALRDDAADVIGKLRHAGYEVELLSGDRSEVVAAAARNAGILNWHGEVKPDGKIARLAELRAAGSKVLMIGDGLNDAPALAAGHASLSPSSAADITQTAADIVFQGERLTPILEALAVAQAARRAAIQNFGIALAYNAVSVPLAMTGYVTPLIAALAMSGSSIAVTINALRLRTARLNLEPRRAAS